jgi:hypothetical protein
MDWKFMLNEALGLDYRTGHSMGHNSGGNRPLADTSVRTEEAWRVDNTKIVSPSAMVCTG